ncbi:MAG: hypothetical protein QW098_03820 [Candidatus Hadarchaeales archaeon]
MEMRERGFVFSLDACLATVVMMIAVAGLAHLGTGGTPGHGYLKLERCAQDALSVMDGRGITKYVIDSLNNKQYGEAARAARENLLLLLPPTVNFRYTIGTEDNLLVEVYRDTSDNWRGRWENAAERALALHLTCEFIRTVENLDVLIWADDPQDEWFASLVIKPGWTYRMTDEENTFVAYLENSIEPDWYPDVVFLPDVSVYWSDNTLRRVVDYNMFKLIVGGRERGGGVVVGGDTLWSNRRDPWRRFFGIPIWISTYGEFLLMLGISPNPFSSDPGIQRVVGEGYSPSNRRMELVDLTHYVTTGLSFQDVPYQGDDYYQYVYDTSWLLDPWLRTLGRWENWENESLTWPGLLVREAVVDLGIPWFGGITFRFMERTALFNVRIAQSSFDPGFDHVETQRWVTLAQRALEWASRQKAELQPIVLYVWREGR